MPSSPPEPSFRGRLARRILFIVLPLILLPVLLMGFVAYRRAQSLLQIQATQQLRGLVEIQMQDLDAWLRIKQIRLDRALRRPTTAQALERLSQTPPTAPQFPAVRQALLQELHRINRTESLPLFTQFAVVDAAGKVLVSDRQALEGQPVADTPWWSELRARLQEDQIAVHLASAHLSPWLPEGVFGVVTLMRSPQASAGQEVFLLGLSYGPPLEHLLRQLTLPHLPATAYFLTAAGEQVRIDPRHQELVVTPLPPSMEQRLRFLLSRPTFQGLLPYQYTPPEEGGPHLGVAGWLPQAQLGLGIEVPKGAILAQIRSLVPFTVVLLTATALLLALIIWLLTQNIARPIRALARTTRAFAAGDLQARAPVDRHDELGLLAHTFNQMADELSELYRSLEHQVKERTQQIQAAAEVATLATSATQLDEILRRTVDLIVERFPQYYHASIFLLDEENRFAVLRESTGPIGAEMKRLGHRLQVGGTSLVGWAAAHNQPRVASEVAEDPIHFKNPLLPETRSEAAIPLSIGPRVLGVLDVQSKNPYAFDEHAITTLQTLARQLAAAVFNLRLLEMTRIDLAEAQTLYQATRDIAQATSAQEVLHYVEAALQAAPFPALLYFQEEPAATFRLRLAQHLPEGPVPFPAQVTVAPEDLRLLFPQRAPFFARQPEAFASLPADLAQALQSQAFREAALVPLFQGEAIVGWVMLLASQPGQLSPQRVQPYLNLIEVASNALTKLHALANAQLRLTELEILNRLSRALSASDSLEDLYPTLHRELRTLFGDVTFAVALYYPAQGQIRIPYLYEQGEAAPKALPQPFDLSEGLVARVIREQRALLLRHAEEIVQMGGKAMGRAAKSWMGAPLIVGDEILGALLVQDLEQEERFNEEHFRLFVTIAGQVALAIRNLRLLQLSREQAQRQQLLLRTGERLRRTTDLRAILETTTQELRQALKARRAVLRFQRFIPSTPKTPPPSNGSPHEE